MKQTWFSVKVVYDKTQPNGGNKKQKESYLVDALSFTEAEARVTNELAPFVTGDFKVTAMKLENISEVFNCDLPEGDWYKANVAFVSIDEKAEKEKETTFVVMVLAANTDDALARIHERMRGTMSDYKVKQLIQTAYVDLFFYSLESQTDENR